MLSQKRLKELLEYNPESGHFVRIVGRSGPNSRKGDIAGCDNGSGYIRIYVDGAPYKAHRLAWFYMTGEWVPYVDHKNGIKSDNRWCNLRSASKAQNNSNQQIYKNNTSGLKGVSFYRPNGKWKAQIQKDGVKIGLGYFLTKEEAKAAYDQAALRLHGNFARLN